MPSVNYMFETVFTMFVQVFYPRDKVNYWFHSFFSNLPYSISSPKPECHHIHTRCPRAFRNLLSSWSLWPSPPVHKGLSILINVKAPPHLLNLIINWRLPRLQCWYVLLEHFKLLTMFCDGLHDANNQNRVRK